MPPPFIPQTTEGAQSTDNVDEEFKNQDPKLTLCQEMAIKVDFDKFTYNQDKSIVPADKPAPQAVRTKNK